MSVAGTGCSDSLSRRSSSMRVRIVLKSSAARDGDIKSSITLSCVDGPGFAREKGGMGARPADHAGGRDHQELAQIAVCGLDLARSALLWPKCARRTSSIRNGAASTAKAVFDRLGLRDYGRFDFRADADDRIKFMERNPNPARANDGKLAYMAGFAGIAHPGMLRMILEAAQTRAAAERVRAPTGAAAIPDRGEWSPPTPGRRPRSRFRLRSAGP